MTQLEKQLPSKAEMDALLSDINQAGLGRSLVFDLFRPGQVNVKEYYAELPISVRVTGRYHDIGSFAADVANLSRIVTLHNLSIAAPGTKDGGAGHLVMEGTARTYRYLDATEVAEQRKAESAYRRERQRAEEAEGRFRLARRAVDELIRVSEEELAHRPGMEGLRRRLLA